MGVFHLKKRIRKIVPGLFAMARGFKSLYSSRSYLVQCGYMRSHREKRPCSLDGSPLPWMNYGMIDFLENRLRLSHRLFEYGSGYSTQFYAKFVGSITSVEHDKGWFESVMPSCSDNATLLYRELSEHNDEYIQALKSTAKTYDVVIVDGRQRVKCLHEAIQCLTDKGVVILDDSQRDRYQEGIDAMLARGFKRLDFKGLKPAGLQLHQSTVFYKENNCFDI